MNIEEFTNYFLPQLIKEYTLGNIPFHGLVDIDTWKKVFPDTYGTDQFHWYEISFTCNRLQDDSLLLTYKFPQPTLANQPKFAAIHLNPENAPNDEIDYYVLRKPTSIYDAWSIYGVSISDSAEEPELSYIRKIEGTDSLRNFVFTVQQIVTNPPQDSKSAFSILKDFIKTAISTQE